MTARDELRSTLAWPIATASNHPVPSSVLGRDLSKLIDAATDAVLAAGYTKPREITTVEELKALPNRSVIREPHGPLVIRVIGGNWMLAAFAQMDPWPSEQIELPATVLWEPTA